MEQLLSIKTVPLEYELKITPARLEHTSKKSQVEINRTPGGFQMRSSMVKLNLDTSAARNSVCPTTRVSISQAAQKGKQAAQDYVARTAKEGEMLVTATPDQNVLGEITRQRVAPPTGEFTMGFIPTTGPEIQYVEPTLDVQYQTDQLEFQVRVANGNLEFTPGDVSMSITQWPDVIIEYLGKPMYVPPSSQESPFIARA